MSACVHDPLCLPLFAEDDLEGVLEALAHWRDSDVDELDAHDDLQLLAELRVGDIAARGPLVPPWVAFEVPSAAATKVARMSMHLEAVTA